MLKSFALDCVKWSYMVNNFWVFQSICFRRLRSWPTCYGIRRSQGVVYFHLHEKLRNSIDCKNIWWGKVYMYILGFVKNTTKLFDFLLGPVLALLLTFYEYCWFWLAKVITDCAATAHWFSLSLSDLNSLACEFNSSQRVITSK